MIVGIATHIPRAIFKRATRSALFKISWSADHEKNGICGRINVIVTFPVTPAEITVDWLTSVLRDGGHIDAASVSDVSFELLEGGVDGAVTRMALEYDHLEPNAPKNIVAKQAELNPGVLNRMLESGGNRREVYFYEKLAAEFPLRTPSTFHQEYDANSGHFIILMEDLGHLESFRHEDGVSANYVTIAVTGLVGMHARYWNSPYLDQLDWLAGATREQRRSYQNAEAYRARVTDKLDEMQHFLPTGVSEIARVFGEHFEKVWDHLNLAPWTLTHGDYRLANFFFDDDEVVAVDWTTPGKSRAATDLAQAIVWSMVPSDRIEHETRILRQYHSDLVGCGVRGYSFDELLEDYRWALFPLLVPTVWLTNMMERVPEWGMEQSRPFFDASQALVDWNCGELLR